MIGGVSVEMDIRKGSLERNLGSEIGAYRPPLKILEAGVVPSDNGGLVPKIAKAFEAKV